MKSWLWPSSMYTWPVHDTPHQASSLQSLQGVRSFLPPAFSPYTTIVYLLKITKWESGGKLAQILQQLGCGSEAIARELRRRLKNGKQYSA